MGFGLYRGVGNLLTFVSFCDKNTGVRVICGAGYSPENTVVFFVGSYSFQILFTVFSSFVTHILHAVLQCNTATVVLVFTNFGHGFAVWGVFSCGFATGIC